MKMTAVKAVIVSKLSYNTANSKPETVAEYEFNCFCCALRRERNLVYSKVCGENADSSILSLGWFDGRRENFNRPF